MPKEKILVVDDEEDILELVRFNLSKEGYRAICAETGERAVQIARSEIPDLIVLDLMLPGIDGLEVTTSLKKNPETQHIPIVMLTAKGEESDVVTGLELGADDYVTKPFSPKMKVRRPPGRIRNGEYPQPGYSSGASRGPGGWRTGGFDLYGIWRSEVSGSKAWLGVHPDPDCRLGSRE